MPVNQHSLLLRAGTELRAGMCEQLVCPILLMYSTHLTTHVTVLGIKDGFKKQNSSTKMDQPSPLSLRAKLKEDKEANVLDLLVLPRSSTFLR